MSEQADAARERVLAALRSVEITGADDGAWTAVLDEVQALEALDAYGAVMRLEELRWVLGGSGQPAPTRKQIRARLADLEVRE